MTYDGFVLAAVVAELERTITRGRIQKVRQHNDTDITLEIRGIGHTYMLFFSVDARFSRVYLTSSALPVPQEPPNFRMVMRKYAQGAFVTGIRQIGMDRVMHIELDSSEHGRLTLAFEIMGKHSNLILLNAEGKILGAIKHVGSSVSRYRQVLPGRDYIPPPGSEKADPREVRPETFDRLWSTTLPEEADPADAHKWLINTFSGFGPFLADEITMRAEHNGRIPKEAVREELLSLSEMARLGTFMPVMITNERGNSQMVYPMPSVQFPPSQQHSRASINEALDALFRSLVSRTRLDDERSQLLVAIRRSMAARKQTLKSIERTLAESEKADRYRELGEILLANIHAIEKGEKSVCLPDFFDPEMNEIQIELDEKLTPQQNAERYFRRYQKARDSITTAQQRKVQVMREIGILSAAIQESESANKVDALKELRAMLLSQDLLRAETVPQQHPEDEFQGHRIRRITTPEGWEILYGENSQSNDYLTQRVARPNDVWLHARSITGAHVVIRTAGHSGGVPGPVLRLAAKIAAQNSEAKHSSLVPVDSTLRKYVRKPRGAAPGFVIYRNEKTIDIDPKA